MKTMNKASVMILLGVAQAATPGPTPAAATFPKFATPVDPTGTTVSGNAVKSTYLVSGTTASGLYRAYRNDLIIFPTQSLTIGGTSVAQTIVAQTFTRTFY